MSKKHFVALAARLRSMRPHSASALKQWREMVQSMASFCAEQNDRFDRSRFLVACGMEE